MRVVIGDLDGPERDDPDVIMLTDPDAGLAEVIATQLPLLAVRRPKDVELRLGGRDLLDGYDESYVHARLVELCDGLAATVPEANVMIIGIPATEGDNTDLRRQVNASARVTAELRGFGFRAC